MADGWTSLIDTFEASRAANTRSRPPSSSGLRGWDALMAPPARPSSGGGQRAQEGGGNFPASLIRTESGGNWRAMNNEVGSGGVRGHGGRLQFGQARLNDAARAGAIRKMSVREFANSSPEVQMAAENWHFSDIDREIDNSIAGQMIGQTIRGVRVTRDGLRAVAHLGGSGGMIKFARTNGGYNPSDSFGTSLLDYLGTHEARGGSTPSRAAPRQPAFKPGRLWLDLGGM